MKKLIIVLVILLLTMSLFAVWTIGEPITNDYSWVDDSGETHSIHELTESGKAVIMFWGTTG